MLTFMSRPYNLVNWAFWAVLLLLAVWAWVRYGRTRKGPGPAAAALVGLLSLLVVLAAVRLVYVAPFAIVQDIVAAQQVLKGESVPATEIRPLVREALTSEPRPEPLDSVTPWLAAVFPGLSRQEKQEYDDIATIIEVQAHPPFATMLMVPFVYSLGFYHTSLVLSLLSVVCLGATLLMLKRGLGLRLSTCHTILVCGVFLGWYPMFLILRSGQTGTILGMFVVAGWYCLRRGKPILSGVVVGIAASLKLFPALLLVYLLLRHRRAFWAGAATFVLLNAGTMAVVGPQFFLDFAQTARYVTLTWEADLDNWSLLGALHHVGDLVGAPAIASRPVFLVAALGAVSALCVLVLTGRQSESQTDLHYSLFVVAMILLSPTCWSHYFVLLLLPITALAIHVNKEHAWCLLAFLGMGLILAIPHAFHKVAFPCVEPFLGHHAGSALVLLPSLALIGMFLWLALLTRSASYGRDKTTTLAGGALRVA
jgi:hypothetical protein